jgi:hypothetical protein
MLVVVIVLAWLLIGQALAIICVAIEQDSYPRNPVDYTIIVGIVIWPILAYALVRLLLQEHFENCK